MFDLLLQNNATKVCYLLQELENVSTTDLYLEFVEVDLDLPEGEYTYAVVPNDREDTEYVFTTPILKTLVITGDGQVELEDLNPRTGLLRIGKVERNNTVYDDDNKTIYYEG